MYSKTKALKVILRYMEPVENQSCRTPFKDLTNKINEDGQSESNSLTQVIDPKERKRQRERARHAAMTEEQRNEINSKKRRAAMTEEQLSEINRKRCETYHRKKAESMLSNVSKDGEIASNTETTGDVENDDWLHRNDLYQPMQIDKENIG